MGYYKQYSAEDQLRKNRSLEAMDADELAYAIGNITDTLRDGTSPTRAAEDVLDFYCLDRVPAYKLVNAVARTEHMK